MTAFKLILSVPLQAWNPNWDPKADAMSVAISLGQPLDLEAAATKIKALCETVGKGIEL